MSWDEERLLALEIDANYGLVAYPDMSRPAALRDPSPLAVWAWSPRARLLTLAPGVALPGSIDRMEQGTVTSSQPYPGSPSPTILRTTARPTTFGRRDRHT